MHFVAGKTSRDKQSHGSNKNNGKVDAQAEDQVQANLSLEHWKKAFKEAHGRVCPARAGGHACGCLPVLARLVFFLLFLLLFSFLLPVCLSKNKKYIMSLCR